MEMYGWIIGVVVLAGALFAVVRSKNRKKKSYPARPPREDGPNIPR